MVGLLAASARGVGAALPGEAVASVASLLRLDWRTARSWSRSLIAVQRTMGGAVAAATGRLLVRAAEGSPEVARGLAATVSDQLARVDAPHRERYLALVSLAVERHTSAAVSVAEGLPRLMAALDDDALESLVVMGAALQEANPERAASFWKGESREAREAVAQLLPGLALEDVSRRLALYARSHCGEDVQILPAPTAHAGRPAFTDGHHIHLPRRVDTFGDERDFLVYRVGTAMAAGYLEFGTFDLDLGRVPGEWPARRPGEAETRRFFRAARLPTLARDLFAVLERARVEAAVRRAYPGVARDQDLLDRESPLAAPRASTRIELALGLLAGAPWTITDRGVERFVEEGHAAIAALAEDGATVEDTVRLTAGLLPSLEALMPDACQVSGGMGSAGGGAPGGQGEPGSPSPSMGLEDEPAAGLLQRIIGAAVTRPEARGPAEVNLDRAAREAMERGEEGTFTEVRRRLRRRGEADYEEMDAWLTAHPGPAGGLVGRSPRQEAPPPPELEEGVEPPGAGGPRSTSYEEWDSSIQDYRPRWVTVRDYRLEPTGGDFVDSVSAAGRGVIRRLRRQFEALRPAALEVVRGVSEGDELDMDRVVEAFTMRRVGGGAPDGLYKRKERSRRDVAVAFLLDMSSSTNEVVSGGEKRIISLEKEALVYIAEAVDSVGDAFAIYGFSGYGPRQVAFYVAKEFHEPYGQDARSRIGAMTWKMENRDGAAIRHATARLMAWPARVRLLVLLSDGHPLDCGCRRYQEAYAREDTRMALVEARRAGLHPFCVTVDPHSRDYLRQIYGEGGYVIIDKVEDLPLWLPRIYRRLTL